MTTGFFHDERCLWHGGGNYSFTLPAGGLVQPGGGLPENPETKRRLVNLLQVTGLWQELQVSSAPEATRDDLLRVHPASYLDAFKAASDTGGGDLGLRTPFGQGGYEIAALSAGLAKAAVFAVLQGQLDNAYALSRPPGHHCLPDFPNGFCLLNNIGIAIQAARAVGLAHRFVVLDWDVHHGNGTETVFWDDPDVLTISLHQDRNYPMDTGAVTARGGDGALGTNVNIPLPAGTGHANYIEALERIALPLIARHQPEIIVVACGYDAAAIDPLGRMLATSETFQIMTQMVMATADELCGSRLVLVHEGGYSEVYVPFCGHAVLQQIAGAMTDAPDPLAETLRARQPDHVWQSHISAHISGLVEAIL